MRTAERDPRLALLGSPRHLALAAVLAGLITGPVGPRAVVVAVAVTVVLAGAFGQRVRPTGGWWPPVQVVGLAALVLLGGVAAHARLAALDRTALGPSLERALIARAVVLEGPRPQRFGGWRFAVRLRSDPGAGERVALAGKARAFAGGAPQVGEEIAVRGRLSKLAAWQGYERIRGAHAALAADAVATTGRRRDGLAGAVDAIRRRAQTGVGRGMAPAQAALARGMVLGDDGALDDGAREDFRASGLAHLLAASGSNVALLALLATGLGMTLGLGLRGRLVLALGVVALYVPLAGGGASILRAGIMGGAAIVAGLAGRPASRAYALLVAAVVTLALNPRAVLDPGWQLSFAAVLAIALLATRWRIALERRGLPRLLAEAVALSAAATVGTAPLLAAHFDRLSLISPLANVLAAPAVAPVVWLGTVAAVLAQWPVTAPLAGAVNAVAALALGFVGAVAHLAARAPAAAVPLALSPVAALGAYTGLGAILTSRRARRLAAGAVIAGLGVAAWAQAHPPQPPRDLTVSFLDVGQGDATLIQHGRAAILVDTGPPDGPVLARLHAAGVRRLDLLVLTHAQADHEGSAARVLTAMPVAAVLDGGDGVRSPERAAIEAAEATRGTRRIVPDAGQLLRVGPLSLHVLWPHAEAAALHAGADPNQRAIVAVLGEGVFRLLLTADAESDVTAPLELLPVSALKVAHHGSRDAGLPALLARLRPAFAAIEVGARNTYGHPAPSTLAALRGIPTVVRTDRDGTVRLTVRGAAMRLRTHAP